MKKEDMRQPEGMRRAGGIRQYEDMLYLPHHVSKTHPQMSIRERAAQFSPFMALGGYSDAIREEARLTEAWAEPEEEALKELDRKLALLQEHLAERPEVTAVYFCQDDKKAGGAYRSVTGRLKKIDVYGQTLYLEDGTALEARHVVQMESSLFGTEFED